MDDMEQAAARRLNEAIEETELSARRFTASAGLVREAYTQALGRVEEALGRLRTQFQAVAAVGLNAFSRLLSGLEPVIRGLSGAVTRLFGVEVWLSGTRAAQGTAKAMEKAAKSARSAARAQRDLMSFDQIDRLSAPGGGGGSSGGGNVSASGEEGEPWAKLLRVEGALQRVFARIWAPFRAGWEQEGAKVLRAAKSAAEGLGKVFTSLGESWLSVWENGSGEETVTALLQMAQGLLSALSGLGGQLSKAWETLDKGERIFQALAEGANALLAHLRAMAQATADWASGLDLNGLVRGLLRVTEALRPLADLLGGALSWGYTNVLLPLGKWTMEEAGPRVLGVLSAGLDALTAALQALAPMGQAVWNGVLKPLGNWGCNTLLTGLELAKRGFQSLSAVFASLPAKWEAFKNQLLTLWQTLTGGLTGSANTCRAGLLSIFGGITEGIGQKLGGIREALTRPFKNGLNAVIELVNKVIGKINGALKFSWDPIRVMGKVIAPGGSVTLARISTIPKLAQGGLVTGPTLSLVGEAGREAVLPLDRNTGWMDALADKLSRTLGERRDPTVVEVYVGGERLVSQVVSGINAETRRSGRCPICI